MNVSLAVEEVFNNCCVIRNHPLCGVHLSHILLNHFVVENCCRVYIWRFTDTEANNLTP